MKHDVLYNFISPVTGRILCDYNHILVGDINGIAIPSMSLPIGNLPDLTLSQFWVGNENNRPVETTVDIPVCDVATTSNIIATYDNGTDGVGATLTIPGIIIIDGTLIPLGSLILVKDQIISYENGVYLYSDQAVTATFIRADYYDEIQEIRVGDSVSVEAGNENALSTWLQTATVTNIGVDSINYIGPMGPAGPQGERGKRGKKGDDGDRGSSGGGGGGGGGIGGLIGGLIGSAVVGIASGLGEPIGLIDDPTKNPGIEDFAGKPTVFTDSNINLVGGRLENIAQSPEADFDAVSARFIWDILNDNVEIKWE